MNITVIIILIIFIITILFTIILPFTIKWPFKWFKKSSKTKENLSDFGYAYVNIKNSSGNDITITASQECIDDIKLNNITIPLNKPSVSIITKNGEISVIKFKGRYPAGCGANDDQFIYITIKDSTGKEYKCRLVGTCTTAVCMVQIFAKEQDCNFGTLRNESNFDIIVPNTQPKPKPKPKPMQDTKYGCCSQKDGKLTDYCKPPYTAYPYTTVSNTFECTCLNVDKCPKAWCLGKLSCPLPYKPCDRGLKNTPNVGTSNLTNFKCE